MEREIWREGESRKDEQKVKGSREKERTKLSEIRRKEGKREREQKVKRKEGKDRRIWRTPTVMNKKE